MRPFGDERVPVVFLGDRANNEQSQARTGAILVAVRAPPAGLLEDRFSHVLGDTRSLVFNLDDRGRSLGAAADVDGCVRLLELHRVLEPLADPPREPALVDPRADRRIDVESDLAT